MVWCAVIFFALGATFGLFVVSLFNCSDNGECNNSCYQGTDSKDRKENIPPDPPRNAKSSITKPDEYYLKLIDKLNEVDK